MTDHVPHEPADAPQEPTYDHDVLAYPSFAALRMAHTEILRRQHEEGLSPSLLGQAAEFIACGSATGAILDDEDERDAAQGLLDYWATILIRKGYEPPDATLDEFDPSLAPELDDASFPYVGLDPFREEDAARFFGRRRLVEFLVNRLRNQRVLVLVGPSGAGKSSVVRAGLVPALKQGALPGSSTWRYAPVVTPGERPLLHLARALHRLQDQPDVSVSDEELAERFRDPHQVVAAADGNEPVVLVIDQLEEMFTLTDDETERHAFIEAIAALAGHPSPRHTVLMTMRSDFESFIALESSLQRLIEQARVQLLPLSASEMREAIERPAELVGLKFEQGVVDALLHDTLGEPAALPLLQFSLLKLWEARDRNRVTWQAYQQIGGGRQALARSADALYNSLIPEDQVTARRILMRMVRPGEGLEITSHRIRRDQLYRTGEARDRVDRVLERLIAARLLRLTPDDAPGGAQVEIAHEALVRNWPTLVGWLEDERAAIATRRRLEAKAAEWIRLGGGSAGLLDEVQLSEAERWLDSAEAAYLGYNEALRDLVVASRAAIEQARRAEEEQRRRELEQAQALAEARRIQAEQNEKLAIEQGKRAEAEARSARRLRLIVLTMAVALIGAIFSGVLLLFQRSQLRTTASELATQVGISNMALATAGAAVQDAQAAARRAQDAAATSQAAESLALLRGTAVALAAAQEAQARQTAEALVVALEQQARQARAGRLAALAQAEAENRPILSLLLAIEAVQVTLHKGEAPLPVADDALRGSLARIGGVGLNVGEPVVAGAASDDGAVAALLTTSGVLQVWNLTDLNASPRVASAPGAATLLALSRDGTRLATAGADPASIRLWNLSGTTLTARELAGPGGINTAMTISRDGRLLAVGDNGGATLVYDLTNLSAPPRRLSGLGGRSGIRSLAFSPDSRLLATGNDDSQARLYNLESGSGTYTRERTRGALTSITFSDNGRWLAYGSAGGQVRLWSLSGAQFDSVYVLLGLTAPITRVQIASGKMLVIAGSADGTTCLWELEARNDNRARTVLRGQSDRITGLAVNGNASILATASADGRVVLWDLTTADPGVKPVILRGHDNAVTDVAIPANTSLMLTIGADGMARVWNLNAPLFAPESLPQTGQELLDIACRTAGRTLSETEWNTYFEGIPYNPVCK
ncbi:AAA family ATPase [Roseiflexus sp.]|uniref:nSTAND1 domain-containing NTPase n=2 Tax=Roseiflexus sp. TaxID=2562120 RepID=UPI00398BB1DE